MPFERIREERRSADELLLLMSFFNAQGKGIPMWLLRSYSRDVESSDDGEAASAFEEDLDTPQAYLLVTLTENSNACEMHARVQLCAPVWLSTFGDLKRWNSKFMALMVREFPRANFKNLAICQQLLPYIKSWYKSEAPGEKPVKDSGKVLNCAAQCI